MAESVIALLHDFELWVTSKAVGQCQENIPPLLTAATQARSKRGGGACETIALKPLAGNQPESSQTRTNKSQTGIVG